jgi:DNA-directed RNA polymerase subunit RPC12/RpoP
VKTVDVIDVHKATTDRNPPLYQARCGSCSAYLLSKEADTWECWRCGYKGKPKAMRGHSNVIPLRPSKLKVWKCQGCGHSIRGHSSALHLPYRCFLCDEEYEEVSS